MLIIEETYGPEGSLAKGDSVLHSVALVVEDRINVEGHLHIFHQELSRMGKKRS